MIVVCCGFMLFKESETVELKKSASQLDRPLEDICEFCNHKGEKEILTF